MGTLRLLFWAPVLLLAAALWLVGTESGLGWAWWLLRPHLPAAVTVEEVAGRLVGPVTVRGLRVSDAAGGGLAVERLTVDWAPMRLLSGEVHVSSVDLDGPRYTGTTDEAGESPRGEGGLELPDLPVAVTVTDVVVRRIVYASSPEADPVRLAQVGLTRLWLDGDGLAVDGLAVRDPRLRADGELRLGRGAGGAVAASADWRLEPPERAPMTGRATADGSRAALQVSAALDAPYSANLSAELTDPLTAPAFALDLDAREARTDAWLGEPPEGLPETLGLSLTAEGAWEEGALSLAHAELRQRDTGTRIRAEGRFSPGGDTDLGLEWTDLRWPVTGEALAASPGGSARLRGGPGDWRAELSAALAPSGDVSGSFRLDGEQVTGDLEWREVIAGPVASPAGELGFEGRLDDYRLTARARVRHEAAGDFRLALTAHGDRERLVVEDLDASLLEGTLTGQGEIAWQPALRFRARLRGRGLNPGRLDAAWPGLLDIDVAANGSRAEDAWRAEVTRLEVNGRLRERPVQASGAIAWDGRQLHLANVRVEAGASRATLDGRAGGRWDLAWRLDSPDLGDLLPGAAGELAGEGSLRGRTPELALRAELEGGNLRYREWTAGRLALDATVDLAGERVSRLILDGEDLGVAGGPWDLHVEGSGRPRDHRVDVALEGKHVGTELTVTGDWRPGDWRGNLVAARVEPSVGPPWSLADAAAMSYDDVTFRLDRTCLAAEDARTCLAFGAGPGRVDGVFELDSLPLALAEILLPPEVTVDGALSAAGGFGYTDGAPRLDLDFSTTGIAVSAPEIDDEAPLLGAAPGGGRLRLTPRGGELKLAFDLRPAGHLRADITLGAAAAPASRTLDGEISAAMPDLAPLAVLSPEVESMAGRLDGTLRLGGRLDAPTVSGALELAEGRAVLPRPGLTLTDIGIELGGGEEGLELSGSARSGEGELRLTGRLGGSSARDARLRIAGEDFQVFNTADARVAVSPDLDLALAGRRLEVRGTVHVPGARITPRDIAGSGAVPVSRDQVIVRDGEEPEPPLTVDAKVRVTLGEDVRVEAFGLKADMGGAITVRQAPGRLTTATGDLEVLEGEYRAYGQGLKIETGRLLFTGGPVDDPGLDVRAVRRPREDVTVGVAARGTLREPEFRLFSEPAMSQTKQLSWLVLGRPLEETSGGEASALAQAAIGLGIKGGDFLGRRLQDNLGLDTFGVESEAGGPRDQAAFVIGKYLSPRLYVSYGIGLLQPGNVLRLRYEISRRWTLLTESGTEAGGDLTYSIER